MKETSTEPTGTEMPPSTNSDNDLARQSHYMGFQIQPIEFIERNGFGFLEGNVIKYVTRYKVKGGLSDLLKARVYLDWIIEKHKTGNITVAKSAFVKEGT